MGEERSHWPCTGPVPGSEIKPPLRTLRACAREHPAFLLKPRLRPSQLAGGTLGGVWLGLLTGVSPRPACGLAGMLVSCPWGWAHLTVSPSYLFAPASLELPESQTTSYSATSPQQSTEDRLLTALAKYLLNNSGTGPTGSAAPPPPLCNASRGQPRWF